MWGSAHVPGLYCLVYFEIKAIKIVAAKTNTSIVTLREVLLEYVEWLAQNSSVGVVEMSLPFRAGGWLQVTPLMAWDRIHTTKSLDPKRHVQFIP